MSGGDDFDVRGPLDIFRPSGARTPPVEQIMELDNDRIPRLRFLSYFPASFKQLEVNYARCKKMKFICFSSSTLSKKSHPFSVDVISVVELLLYSSQ